MYCPKCGKENEEGAVFCRHCGASMSSDNSISFEHLNKGNGPMERLRAEANKARTFGILSIVFGCLGSFFCIVFAIINISTVNAVNQMNFFPTDMSQLDAYEESKKTLYNGRKMSIIGLIIYAVSFVLSMVLFVILQLSGIDVMSYLAY